LIEKEIDVEESKSIQENVLKFISRQTHFRHDQHGDEEIKLILFEGKIPSHMIRFALCSLIKN
jgi:hypothetical protein